MRTTLKIDDQLLAKAQQITGVTGKSVLVHEGLKALIERESANGWPSWEAVSRTFGPYPAARQG